ncbi:MAG: 5-bromo-4-chloroindolyl phosphate hydrolysis protein [Gammaproteobacteria bacterium]|nr:5-bromo-4-chloroindolyl phosphate hydrolysis protein [Gammaproteobacteria bacterium]
MAEPYTRETAGYWASQGVLLFVLPLPLLWVVLTTLINGQSGRLMFSLIALALLWLGAILNRNGLQAERSFRRQKIATAPATPKKTLGAVLVGLGTFVTMTALVGNGLVVGAIAGALATFGAILHYGTDPRGSKGVKAATHGFSTAEIVAALSDANDKIAAIDLAGRKIPNTELGQRLQRITAKARDIIAAIEEDPGDLRRARKFLNTYLDGARKVTEGYATTHQNDSGGELESNFRNVLETIETTFSEQHEKLLQDDVFDLDVQIEVLKIQLEKEGVT